MGSVKSLVDGTLGRLLENQQTLDSIPVPLFIRDTDGRYMAVNEAFRGLLVDCGYTQADPGESGLPEDNVMPISAALTEQVLQEGQSVYSEVEGHLGGDVQHNFGICLAPVPGSTGETVGLIGFAADISAVMVARAEARDRSMLLRAIATVNQIVSTERDAEALIRNVCETLVETRGYRNCWIAVLDENGERRLSCGVGEGDVFGGIIGRMDEGVLPECASKAMEKSGALHCVDISTSCGSCRMSEVGNIEVLTISLEYEGHSHGVMSVSAGKGTVSGSEEEWALEEIGNAVAFGLHSIKAEEELEESRKVLEETNRKLKESHSQLVQSEKMASIGQLAAGVAHEINNPVGFVMSNLGTMTNYIATIKRLLSEYEKICDEVRQSGSDAQKEIVGWIDDFQVSEDIPFVMGDMDDLLSESVDGTERMRDIVQNLKSFARIDEVTVQQADINGCIEATLKIVWNELKYKCTVHKNLGDIPRIKCQPGKLNQVFMNLLVNASQAIEEKGDITIETSETEDGILVRFSDTGSGIPANKLSRIFDPFFTTKEVGKGTGLGLAISYGIIEEHKGTIEVESEVGKGTTFSIRLPLEGIEDREALVRD